jgi:hypothetical protein
MTAKPEIRKLFHQQQRRNIMAIKPPAWCSHAVPDMKKGWVDPKTGELYKSSRFTQAQMNEYNGVAEVPETSLPTAEAAEAEAAIQHIITEGKIEAGINDLLGSMSKVELEEMGRNHGVELDRRKSKKSLISTMKGVLNK